MGKPKIRPPQNQNPWPDWDKIWRGWLRRRGDPSRKILCKSLQGGASRQMGKIYAKIFISIYLFFFNSPTGQTLRRIFARDGSNDAVPGKDVPFGGYNIW